jgi:hypothetical protein
MTMFFSLLKRVELIRTHLSTAKSQSSFELVKKKKKNFTPVQVNNNCVNLPYYCCLLLGGSFGRISTLQTLSSSFLCSLYFGAHLFFESFIKA